MRFLRLAPITLLLLTSCSEPQIHLMANLDQRDLCVKTNYDKTNIRDITGVVTISSFALRTASTTKGAAYLVELGRLVSEHNAKAVDQDAHFTLITEAPSMLRGRSFQMLSAGLICPGLDRQNCRNRNFWFFRNVAPELAAKIVFENTVAKDPSIRACSSRPSAKGS